MPATYQDADLLLRIYDLRRERRLRKSRDFMLHKCTFKNFKDYKKKYPEGSAAGRHWGMVFGYWDTVCTLVAQGAIDEAAFNACNTEHVFLWVKYKPVILGFRQEWEVPEMLAGIEKLASRHPLLATIEQWIAPKQPPAKPKAKKKPKGKAKTAAAGSE